MPKTLTSMEVWHVDRSARIAIPNVAPVAYDLAAYVDGQVHIQDRLGEPGTLEFDLFVGCQPAVANPVFLAKRRVLKLFFNDGTFEEWRITKFERERSGEKAPRIEATRLWADLFTRAARKTLTGGFVDLAFAMPKRTAADLLTSIMATAPAPFVAGSAGAYAAVEKSLLAVGSTHGALLRELCTQLDCEFDVVWDNVASNYKVNLVAEVGGAGVRPIEFGDGLKNNRVSLQQVQETREYFSRVVPLAGPDEEIVTIAKATWAITSAVYNGGTNRTTITLTENAIYVANSPAGTDVEFGNDSGGFFAVVSTATPNQVVVTGNASALTSGRFRLLDDSDLTYVADRAAETSAGIVEDVLRRSDINPFDNLLVGAGISADFASWSAGLPVGWAKIGNPTVTETTDERYAKSGGKAAHIVALKDEGLRTNNVNLTPSGTRKYFSAWAAVRVISGGPIALQLVDSAGKVHPLTEKATSNEDNLRGLSIGGLEPAAGNAQLRIIALADCTYTIDSAVLTNSATPYEYAAEMGPNALWHAAGRRLVDHGGLQPDSFDGVVFDESFLPGSASAEIFIGTRVQVKADGLDFETRVVQLDRWYFSESFRKSFTLSRRRRDLVDRLAEGGPDVPKIPGGITTPKAATPRIFPSAVLSANGDTADVTVLMGVDGENVVLHMRDTEGVAPTIWTAVAGNGSTTRKYVPDLTYYNQIDWFWDGGGTWAQKLNDIPLNRDQVKRVYFQAETEQSSTKSVWVPLVIDLKKQPWLESLGAGWDEGLDRINVEMKGGAWCASANVELDDDPAFGSPLTPVSTTLSDGGRAIVTFNMAPADRNKLWYARATPYNGAALTGLAGVGQVVPVRIEGNNSKSVKINAAAFNPKLSTQGFDRSAHYINPTTLNQQHEYRAELSLGPGVGIVSYGARLYRQTINDLAAVVLYRIDDFGTATQLSSGSHSGTGWAEVSVSITEEDTTNYTYYLEVRLIAVSAAADARCLWGKIGYKTPTLEHTR